MYIKPLLLAAFAGALTAYIMLVRDCGTGKRQNQQAPIENTEK